MNPSKIFLITLLAAPLSLSAGDNFAEASALDFTAPTMIAQGSTADATEENDNGEPAHAGVTANASFWIAMTVPTARRVEIESTGTVAPMSTSLVMAVYTGDSLANLKPVTRYKKHSLPAASQTRDPDGEPFVANARVSFDAKPETTYYIAIDGENGAEGDFELTLSTSRDPMTARFELVPAGASWSYYQALTATAPFTLLNPVTIDPDFHATWHTAANYDGPAFKGPSPSPFSYGTVNAEIPPKTTLVTPETNNRTAVTYFRTTFTPEKNVYGLGFEGSLDDGAIVYINGVEVARMNVAAGTAAYNTPALGASFDGTLGTEEKIQYATATGLNLPAGEEVEIGVSLHNANATSSDAGFHMRVYATETDPDPIVVRSEETEFDKTYRLFWVAEQDTSYNVEFNEGLADDGWTVVNNDPIPAETDGELDYFVFSPGPTGFWRIVTTVPQGE